jgi:hypothetical protein
MDYSALRASPFGSPCGRSPPLRGVVEPALFYVGGSNSRDQLFAPISVIGAFLAFGSPGRIRTADQRINSPSLYH